MHNHPSGRVVAYLSAPLSPSGSCMQIDVPVCTDIRLNGSPMELSMDMEHAIQRHSSMHSVRRVPQVHGVGAKLPGAKPFGGLIVRDILASGLDDAHLDVIGCRTWIVRTGPTCYKSSGNSSNFKQILCILLPHFSLMARDLDYGCKFLPDFLSVWHGLQTKQHNMVISLFGDVKRAVSQDTGSIPICFPPLPKPFQILDRDWGAS
ncbi:hypothetical protein B0H13DRAFT_2485544 [Mycena leptocephala]|nr:hypothetical protein B0H13DRAFT_2485544 [Mycena leptocephala]